MSKPSSLVIFTLVAAFAAALLHEQPQRLRQGAEAPEFRHAVSASVDLVQQARRDVYNGDTHLGRLKLDSALFQVNEAFMLLSDGSHPVLDDWFAAVIKYRNASHENEPLNEIEEELESLEPQMMKLAGR